jgi:hypothetical protein
VNRHARRRQAALDRGNQFFDTYLRHLPPAGPEVVGQPGVHHVVLHHAVRCSVFDGGACDCGPKVGFYSEPQRS